ncbi:Callose synthase 10, partial [Cucurbita argyrosperma subsp. sororia]
MKLATGFSYCTFVFGFELKSIGNFEGEVVGSRFLIQRKSTMARVNGIWERLVRATSKRLRLRNAGQGHGRTPCGIVGAVRS